MSNNIFMQMTKNLLSADAWDTLASANDDLILCDTHDADYFIDALNELQNQLFDSLLCPYAFFTIGSDEIPVEYQPCFQLNYDRLTITFKHPLGMRTVRYHLDRELGDGETLKLACGLYNDDIFSQTDIANTGYDFTLACPDFYD